MLNGSISESFSILIASVLPTVRFIVEGTMPKCPSLMAPTALHREPGHMNMREKRLGFSSPPDGERLSVGTRGTLPEAVG